MRFTSQTLQLALLPCCRSPGTRGYLASLRWSSVSLALARSASSNIASLSRPGSRISRSASRLLANLISQFL